jgi:hypothetical protein
MSESFTSSSIRDGLAIIGGIFAIVSMFYKFIEKFFLQKLLVEVENACWEIHSEKLEGLDTPFGTWVPNFKITNKLGKKTTIHKMIIEFENRKPFESGELNILIEDGEIKNYKEMRCEIGGITYKKYGDRIELHGKARILHLDKEVKIPILAQYRGEEDECPKPQFRLGRTS